MAREPATLPVQSAPRSGRASWADDVPTGTGGIAAFGYAATAVFVGAFGIWAATAPLAGAAIAPGVVAAAGQNITIRHLEGGVIADVLIEDGARVEAGDVMFTMERSAPLAQRNRLVKQRIALEARRERLVAERDGAAGLDFDPELIEGASEEGILDTVEEQLREFEKRRALFESEKLILQQRIGSLREQIAGLEGQAESGRRQQAVIREEVERKKDLLDRGLTNRDEYTALVRADAQLFGQIAQTEASIAAADTQMIEAEEQIVRLETRRAERAVAELSQTRSELADVVEQIGAADAVLNRVEVRAPTDGIVVSIAQRSPGAVVQPGGALADLLPTMDDLVIEARLSPMDIDQVVLGQEASLRFSALNARTTPEVDATVEYISADRLIDEATQEPYFTARLAITELPPEVREEQIYPGMPVETLIQTDERTFLEYLVRPITDSFKRAFTEE